MIKKRVLDIAFAIIFITLFSPLLVIIALLIRLDTKGSAFFVQDRLGIGGKTFPMYKFRTMVVNAEAMGTGLFSYQDDPRITRIGRYLRATSLDELPQLFNVLLGHMSIVGPRPPVTYELGRYEDFTPTMLIRFTVKPGMTGLAQISGRNELNWDDKIKFDNIYVENFNRNGIIEDLVIIFKTCLVVLSMDGIIEKKKD